MCAGFALWLQGDFMTEVRAIEIAEEAILTLLIMAGP